jgi:acyl-CoA thioester hydrolase
VAAEARVDLVLVDLCGGPSRRRLLRQLPQDLEQAVAILRSGPPGTASRP